MSVVTATITSDGQMVDPEFELLYIDVVHEYNKISSAELGYLDGDAATQEYRVSDSAFFQPGAEIEIKLKYEGERSSSKTVFKGVVLKHALQSNAGGCVFVTELTDKAVKMTAVRKSAVNEKIKDSDIISKLIAVNGLEGTVEATEVTHEKLVQYNVTDWDFMVSRAEVNGLLVATDNGNISAKKPSLTGSPVLSLMPGIDEVYEFELEADARSQYKKIQSSSWDVKKQQLTGLTSAAAFSLKQGNLSPEKLALVTNGEDTLISVVSFGEKEAQAWANAKMVRSRLSMLKGRVKISGTAVVKVGDLIELRGVGKRFSGTTLVSGIRHQLTGGGWSTDIQFGVDAEWFLSKNTNVVTPKAAGLLPGINGLQIGVVEKFEEDQEKENRVKVMVPAMGEEKAILWARLISLDAGNNRGVAFWPEPGDEVILGFLNDDPRQAVILGSVHSSAKPSPVKPVEKNPEKGIVTKEGLKMMFNDEKKTIIISTSDNSVITINEKEKSIEIKDANKNSILLSNQGISLKSDKDIIIKSGANVNIEGKAVEIKGNKVDVI